MSVFRFFSYDLPSQRLTCLKVCGDHYFTAWIGDSHLRKEFVSTAVPSGTSIGTVGNNNSIRSKGICRTGQLLDLSHSGVHTSPDLKGSGLFWTCFHPSGFLRYPDHLGGHILFSSEDHSSFSLPFSDPVSDQKPWMPGNFLPASRTFCSSFCVGQRRPGMILPPNGEDYCISCLLRLSVGENRQATLALSQALADPEPVPLSRSQGFQCNIVLI